MPCGFKSDFNFTVVARNDFGVEYFKTFNVVGYGKRFLKYCAFEGACLSSVDSD